MSPCTAAVTSADVGFRYAVRISAGSQVVGCKLGLRFLKFLLLLHVDPGRTCFHPGPFGSKASEHRQTGANVGRLWGLRRVDC